MLRSIAVVLCLGLVVFPCGCGGGGPPPPEPRPPAGGAELVQVGPLQIRTTSTAGFTAQSMPTPAGTCAFVALSGSRITWMASQAFMDRLLYVTDQWYYSHVAMCNLDGSNQVRLNTNTAYETDPQWSPDGTKIAFVRQWGTQDTEIMVMDADGSGVKALTSNTVPDSSPTWSPDSQKIAWESGWPNAEIWTMYADGSEQTNISQNPANDYQPDWSSSTSGAAIAFISDRTGTFEVYRMAPDGTGQARVTNDGIYNYQPAWNSAGTEIACSYELGSAERDIMSVTVATGEWRTLMLGPARDHEPVWSGDDTFIAAESGRNAYLAAHIWLQQTTPPYHAFQVHRNAADQYDPDLGSPAMQTERVLIGPHGSDWGGTDPVFTGADAGIVAFDGRGYRNFVRIGVRTADLPTLQATPLSDTGWDLVGVVVEAAEIVNLKEDAGRGVPPVTWQLDPFNSGAAVLYFGAFSGKLVSVLPVRDVVSPTAARSPTDLVRQRIEGGRLVVEGNFAAVFDAQGHNLAPGGATHATISDGELTAAGE